MINTTNLSVEPGQAQPEKADHCLELAVTHFVDDRSDVLNHLVGIVEHLYLFGARSRGKWPAFTRVGSSPGDRGSHQEDPGGAGGASGSPWARNVRVTVGMDID